MRYNFSQIKLQYFAFKTCFKGINVINLNSVKRYNFKRFAFLCCNMFPLIMVSKTWRSNINRPFTSNCCNRVCFALPSFRIFCMLLGICIVSSLNAQREANIWHFGNGFSLNFNSGQAVQESGSAISTIEGSTSYCDSAGNLLFYSNGGGRFPSSGQSTGRIWNRNKDSTVFCQELAESFQN
jgi:hypothetical protein